MRTRLAIVAVTLLAAVAAVAPGSAATKRVSPTPTFAATTFKAGGGEPDVAISPNGRTILVAGLGGGDPANFWRSTNGGRSFTKIQPSFGGTGGGDWDMRFLDDHTVIAADLGSGVLVDRSEDAGLTWTTTTIEQDVYDRPWLDHFGKDKVYVVAKGFNSIPYLYSSSDGGRSFGSPAIPVIIYGTGTLPAEAGGTNPNIAEAIAGGQNAYVDHLTVDPIRGDVYVLYGLGGIDSYSPSVPTGVSNRLYVAHLEGNMMVSHPVFIGGPSDSFISGFNWLTVDSRGTLYALANGMHNGHHSPWLSYSTDKGVTWSPLVDLAEHPGANVYGSIAAGSPGTLSLVYLHGTGEDPAQDIDWYAEMARVTNANTGRPSVYRTRPVRAPIHRKNICFYGILCGIGPFGDNRNLLDFIWNAIGPDGTAYAVVASDGPATGDNGGDTSILLLKQTGGAKHGRGAPS